MKKTIRRFLFFATITILFIVFSLFSAEVLFRNSVRLGIENSSSWLISPRRKALRARVQARLVRNWSRRYEDRPNVFYQPWIAYRNYDFQNQDRINKIAEATPFPKSQQWVVPNVFRNPSEGSSIEFAVSTNSFGFRDIERPVPKAKNVVRILAMGSYTTFGYGVNSEDTYVRRLEKILNTQPNQKVKYEVWNMGRQGSTGIMGYALLKNKAKSFKPDLILYDYGWADYFTVSDLTSNEGKKLKIVQESIRLKALVFLRRLCYVNAFTSPVLDSTELCKRLTDRFDSAQIAAAASEWEVNLEETTALAKKLKIPLLLLRAISHVPQDTFKSVANETERIYFFDLMDKLEKYKPSDLEIEYFWSRPNWLNEIDLTRSDLQNSGEHSYLRGDALQFGKLGHKAIAELLTPEVLKVLTLSKSQN